MIATLHFSFSPHYFTFSFRHYFARYFAISIFCRISMHCGVATMPLQRGITCDTFRHAIVACLFARCARDCSRGFSMAMPAAVQLPLRGGISRAGGCAYVRFAAATHYASAARYSVPFSPPPCAWHIRVAVPCAAPMPAAA